MSFSYGYILIIQKEKWGKGTNQTIFSHDIHYILNSIDSNYLPPKACHNNIGALEIKPLSPLFMHLAEACKFI